MSNKPLIISIAAAAVLVVVLLSLFSGGEVPTSSPVSDGATPEITAPPQPSDPIPLPDTTNQ